MNLQTASQNPRFLFTLTLVWAAVFIFGLLHFLLAFVVERETHMTLGVLFLVFSFGATAFFAVGWRHTCRQLMSTRTALSTQAVERDSWKERAQMYREGVGRAIGDQMKDWQLTPTEKSTALYLLKGYSHKEIAAMTERSERTVRQHAVDVYRKSGLHGRAELSAFFLEDLLPPRDDAQV